MAPELRNEGRIPFILAAAGHRNLRPQDLDRLKDQVRVVLRDLRKRMPNTPLIVLSGLAAGADQLIAEVSLEPEWHAALVAVLPIPREEYAARMSVPARKNFERLLDQAAFTMESCEPSVTAEAAHHSRDLRIQCYESLAVFLVEHSQAVLALWDGKETESHTGTARVVQFALEEMPSAQAKEHDSLAGLVYHIVTARESGDAAGEAFAIRQLTSARNVLKKPSQEKTEEGIFEVRDVEQTTTGRIMTKIEGFNRHAALIEKQPDRDLSKLIPKASQHRPLPAFLGFLETLHGFADLISMRANRHRKLFFGAILTCALAAALMYGIHADVLVENIDLWLYFPLFIGAALGIHMIAKFSHVEDLYLDSRALAEAIRVQFFWKMAGIDEAVDRHYLIHHHTPLDWIRAALRNIWLMRSNSIAPAGPSADVSDIQYYWVRNQADWYLDHAKTQSVNVRRRQKISQMALWIAVIWSIVIPLSLKVPPGHIAAIDAWQNLALPRKSLLYGLLHVALTVPALLAGGYRLWIEQAAYEEQAREYEYMGKSFLRKSKEILHTTDKKRQMQELREIGIDALKENGRWLLLHREKPLHVDHPG